MSARRKDSGPIFVKGYIPPAVCPACGAGGLEYTTAMREDAAGARARVPVVSCSSCEHVHEQTNIIRGPRVVAVALP